jgi:ribosomal protein S11
VGGTAGLAIFAAFQRVLRKGSPYAFQILADRAFGKLKETHVIEHSP